ncbi:MAG: hypothetical protein ACYSUS_04980 [Planctomycetota bacterium]
MTKIQNYRPLPMAGVGCGGHFLPPVLCCRRPYRMVRSAADVDYDGLLSG